MASLWEPVGILILQSDRPAHPAWTLGKKAVHPQDRRERREQLGSAHPLSPSRLTHQVSHSHLPGGRATRVGKACRTVPTDDPRGRKYQEEGRSAPHPKGF